MSRSHALEIERQRAKQVASLPVPAEFRADRELERLAAERGKAAAKVVTMHEANLFATTRYHMPDTYVDPAAGNCLDIIYNICLCMGCFFCGSMFGKFLSTTEQF